ncbi:hypothetical protein [Streptomyces lydicus]|uniref:hypothetical protein n=1 Tax=Streptomyces lydicus TaxID=47763 RepID=UPI00379E6DD9
MSTAAGGGTWKPSVRGAWGRSAFHRTVSQDCKVCGSVSRTVVASGCSHRS